MKRNRISIFFLIAAIVIVFCACGSPQSSAPDPGPQADTPDVTDAAPVTFTFAHSYAPDSMLGTLCDLLASEINKETNGSVEAIVYPSDTLVPIDQAFEAVTSGRVDVMDLQVTYYAPYLNDLSVLSIPGILKGGDVLKLNATLAEPVDRYLQQNGLKLIAAYGTTATHWFVGNFLVKDPANDFKGKNIRASGAVNGEAVSKWGGAPMSIPLGDLQTALERGTVSMVMTAWEIVTGFQLYESAPNVTASPMAVPFCGLVMNLDKWNSFSKEQQEGILRAGKTFETEGYKRVADEKQKYMDIMAEANVAFYESTDADFEFFHKHAMEMLNASFEDPSETVQEFLNAIKSLL